MSVIHDIDRTSWQVSDKPPCEAGS